MIAQRIIHRVATRLFSTSTSVHARVECQIDQTTGIATVLLNNPPVNSLNLETLTELNISFDKLHAEGCRGMIFGSTKPSIFSAGLDILEMYQPDEARLREFWRQLQQMWLNLYGSKMVTIAAITGHAPAGGCLMAMSCDYRVMADSKITIGLNETLLGIVAPFWFMDTIVNTIGQRQSEKALQLGSLFSPSDALAVGMVDEVVPVDEVLTKCQTEMTRWLKIPDHARELSKFQLRRPALERLMVKREEDIDRFVKFTLTESIQKSLGMYLAALKKKSQAKK